MIPMCEFWETPCNKENCRLYTTIWCPITLHSIEKIEKNDNRTPEQKKQTVTMTVQYQREQGLSEEEEGYLREWVAERGYNLDEI